MAPMDSHLIDLIDVDAPPYKNSNSPESRYKGFREIMTLEEFELYRKKIMSMDLP